jgi:hypothetical protein
MALNAAHKLDHESANVDVCSGEDTGADADVTGTPIARKIVKIVKIVNNLVFIGFILL